MRQKAERRAETTAVGGFPARALTTTRPIAAPPTRAASRTGWLCTGWTASACGALPLKLHTGRTNTGTACAQAYADAVITRTETAAPETVARSARRRPTAASVRRA